MKKIICLAVLGFSCINFANAVTTTVHKQGGGSSGYDKVKETSGDGWKELNCNNPGNSACKFSSRVVIGTGDTEQTVDGDVAEFVESQIAKDITSGTYTVGDDVVVWAVDEDGGYTITIN